MFRIQVQTTRVSRKGKNICVTLLITFFMAFGAIGFNKPLTARAAANTYYVSTSGSDNNAGTLSKPWRTIQKAANVAVGGDTVLIRGGTYNERVDRSGWNGNWNHVWRWSISHLEHRLYPCLRIENPTFQRCRNICRLLGKHFVRE